MICISTDQCQVPVATLTQHCCLQCCQCRHLTQLCHTAHRPYTAPADDRPDESFMHECMPLFLLVSVTEYLNISIEITINYRFLWSLPKVRKLGNNMQLHSMHTAYGHQSTLCARNEVVWASQLETSITQHSTLVIWHVSVINTQTNLWLPCWQWHVTTNDYRDVSLSADNDTSR